MSEIQPGSVTHGEVPVKIKYDTVNSVESPAYRISTKIATLPDGASTRVTILRGNPNTRYGLMGDARFVEDRIKVGENNLLIDQKGTRSSWGGDEVGQRPEELIAFEDKDTVALCPTNWGWQRYVFLVSSGRLNHLPNDENVSTALNILGFKDGKWQVVNIEVEEGELSIMSKEKISGMEMGFDMPMLVEGGKPVDLSKIAGHKRILADPRNYFDFGLGHGPELGGDYWEIIRAFLPNTEEDMVKLENGEIVKTSAKVPKEQTDLLVQKIEEHGMSDTFSVQRDNDDPEMAYLEIKKRLPYNRLPVFGIGHDSEGNLVAIAADGRQESSAGLTLEELTQIMLENGIVNGGLGSAGGDVAIVRNTGKREYNILNSPSNKNPEGESITRPVPYVLMMSPQPTSEQ